MLVISLLVNPPQQPPSATPCLRRVQVDTTKRVEEEARDGLISLLFVSFSWLSASPTAAFPGEDLPRTHTDLQSGNKIIREGLRAICIECLPSEADFLLCAARIWGFSAEQQALDDSSSP